MTRFRLALSLILCLTVLFGGAFFHAAEGHEHSLHRFKRSRRAARNRALAKAEQPAAKESEEAKCQLTIKIVDSQSGQVLPGMIRIARAASGKYLRLNDLIERDENYFAIAAGETITLPQTKIKIEAFQGLGTEITTQSVDLTGNAKKSTTLKLVRFYDPAAAGLASGNTHLHLNNMTHAEAVRYLQLLPEADNLDLVFLSHLRRIPDERAYISNQFTLADLKRLSLKGALFSNGEEHRHNFGRGGEGYGHVMFLEIAKLIRPVSIGPGIMRTGTDGIPLQRGIQEAHRDRATVIWCHNTFGMEDLPNWVAGTLDAQNINDGSPHGDYNASYYRYLNLGMRVPFSTGTDWFLYDFSRVYVPHEGELTSRGWLEQLSAGKSYITNGPFLEFEIDGASLGETIALSGPTTLNIKGRGLGRNDFQQIEVVYNGQVVQTQKAVAKEGHYTADVNFKFKADKPGWIALRIPMEAGKNEFGKLQYAHTSPIYLELAGKRIFRKDIAQGMIDEMQDSMKTIEEKGIFADDEERDNVMEVYLNAIDTLQEQIKQN